MGEFRTGRSATVSRSQTHQQFPELALVIPLVHQDCNDGPLVQVDLAELLPKGFKLISADEVKTQRGKNLTKRQVYQIRKELKLVK